MIGRTVVGMADVEDVMSEWVQLTRVADAAGMSRQAAWRRYGPVR